MLLPLVLCLLLVGWATADPDPADAGVAQFLELQLYMADASLCDSFCEWTGRLSELANASNNAMVRRFIEALHHDLGEGFRKARHDFILKLRTAMRDEHRVPTWL